MEHRFIVRLRHHHWLNQHYVLNNSTNYYCWPCWQNSNICTKCTINLWCFYLLIVLFSCQHCFISAFCITFPLFSSENILYCVLLSTAAHAPLLFCTGERGAAWVEACRPAVEKKQLSWLHNSHLAIIHSVAHNKCSRIAPCSQFTASPGCAVKNSSVEPFPFQKLFQKYCEMAGL